MFAQVQNGTVVCVTMAANAPQAGTLGVPGLPWIPVPADAAAAGVTPGWAYDGTAWLAPPPNPSQVAAGRVQSYGAALTNGIVVAQGWQTTMASLAAGQPLTAGQVACLQQQTAAWVRLLTFLDHLLDAQGFQSGS